LRYRPSATRGTFSSFLPDFPLLGRYYCQSGLLCVALRNASFSPDERFQLHLLPVLYVCVFWRGEAEHLTNFSSLKSFQPTARNEPAGGFFIFRSNQFPSQ
jgi:hypothetical protein